MTALCVMQFVPAADGIGGAQRAMFLLRALAEIARVHLVLIHPDNGLRLREDSEPAIRELAETTTLVPIPSWKRTSDRIPLLHRRLGIWFDRLRMGALPAPRFSRRQLRAVAERLPVREVDLVFAGRLPAATVCDALLDAGFLATRSKVVDFDDVLSKVAAREAATLGWRKLDRKLDKTIDAAVVRRAETRILRTWNGVSVCGPEDAAGLEAAVPEAAVLQIPNVVERPFLPGASGSRPNVLFVGNLNFEPNAHGLDRFLDGAWPLVTNALPDARLDVVGFDPRPGLADRLERIGAGLHSNVPSVLPFYEKADMVIAPIFFGGGTRIKILEAMAYGRPVVATPAGAEGLSLTNGRHALIAASMDDFAAAVVRLARDVTLRGEIARQARAFQEARYGRRAMSTAVRELVLGVREAAPVGEGASLDGLARPA